MVDLTHAADMARKANPARPTRLWWAVILLAGIVVGQAITAHQAAHLYEDGYSDGQVAGAIAAHAQEKAWRDAQSKREHHMGLCGYAINACHMATTP